MIPDFMYSLKNEKMYYEISNKLIEIWELEKKERAKLPKLEHPTLTTLKPNYDQMTQYDKEFFKYHKELDEYKAIKTKLDNDKSWQEIINTYVSTYYTSSIPIGLIEKFIFNKYKYYTYADRFEAYVEMLDWFEENNITAIEGNNDSSN